MGKLILLIIFVLFGCNQASGSVVPINKQRLITQAQQWVASETGVTVDQVSIKAMDRRLKVPECSLPFGISFAYRSSQKTIRVACEESNWQVFIGVTLTKKQSGWVFISDMDAGVILSEKDVIPAKVSPSVKGIINDLSALAGKSLAKSVRRGQPVLSQYLVDNVTVYKLLRDVLSGEMIGLSNVVEIERSKHLATAANLFPGRLLKKATAANDLREGTILSKNDIHIKQSIMVAKNTILRGQKVSSANAALGDYYGDVPSDVILSPLGITQMEALRTVRPGQFIRASDLKLAAMIEKGDSVTLIVGNGALRISMPMIAMENGKLNQQITLLNPDSNKKVRAIVSGPGEASGIK